MLRAELSVSTNGAELILSAPFDSRRTRGILLDIEGTTTPIDFVYKTLFPFASTHIEEFLTAHIQENEIYSLVDELRQHHKRDAQSEANLHAWCEESNTDRVHSAASYVRWLIARDSKITPAPALAHWVPRVGASRFFLPVAYSRRNCSSPIQLPGI